MEVIQQVSDRYRKESPKKVLARHLSDYSYIELMPITGGWGYAKEDACIIDKNDPIVASSGFAFDGYAIEKMFVTLRTEEELLLGATGIFNGYILLGIHPTGQALIVDEDRKFDRLSFEVEAISQLDFMSCKELLEAPFRSYNRPDIDRETLRQTHQEKIVRMTREFWFDITSFYGNGWGS